MRLFALLIWITILTYFTIGHAEEDAYIQFPDGSMVENPFNGEFFEEDPAPIPSGYANPRRTIPQLVDGADPAGFGTTCDLYGGEKSVVKALKERFGLSNEESLRCLDLMNMSGIVLAAKFALKEEPIKEDQFIEDIDSMSISNSLKLRYKRVVRDTIRSIRSGEVNVDPFKSSINDEVARTNLFTKVLLDCAHFSQK